MTSINPINVNTQGVGANAGYGASSKPEKELDKNPETPPAAAEKTPVKPDAVLNFLAASSASVVPKQALNPAKYVDEASEARIAAFMGNFEEKVAEGLKAFDAEFSGMNISEGAKMMAVLKQVEREA